MYVRLNLNLVVGKKIFIYLHNTQELLFTRIASSLHFKKFCEEEEKGIQQVRKSTFFETFMKGQYSSSNPYKGFKTIILSPKCY